MSAVSASGSTARSVTDWLGELMETQVIWPHNSSWLQPDAQTISAASSWHKDAYVVFTKLHYLSPMHYKSSFFFFPSYLQQSLLCDTAYPCGLNNISGALLLKSADFLPMDISSTLNQHCCFILAYSVLQFVLFVLSTQLQIIAAERILGEIKPADSLGENLHTKWSLQPPVALRARRPLHSRQNRCFFGKMSLWSGQFVKHFNNRGRETTVKTEPQWWV